MSILLYRRPDYLQPGTGPINSTECARYVERAKKSETKIPHGLSFDDVLQNRALPPCSLNDFMDYLVYVEHNAENLQFYLWYKDYTRRFDTLPEHEKALSPKWVPNSNEVPDLSNDVERAEKRKTRRDAVMLDSGLESPRSPGFGDMGSMMDSAPSVARSEMSGSTLPTDAEVTTQAGLKWQPFTIQPMREEINRVMRHYLAFTAPRELNISHRDRGQCLHALQHTTHPSALEPAVRIAEAALRGQSHPNFIRWSICNGNKPRVFFVRTMGVSNIALGFVIAILLTLSRANRWFRIFAAIEWFLGISTMVAAYKGLCVILHHTHARNLRPWEHDVEVENGNMQRESFSSHQHNNSMAMSSRNPFEDFKDDASFRPSSLQTFGPKNSFDGAAWAESYEKKSLIKKIFDKETYTQDETLRVLQDKIVLGANLWALIITIPLTVVFVALPKGNFF